jgi:probable F420-dependent oxidoreductase
MKFGLELGSEYLARRPMTARLDAMLEHVRTARHLGFDSVLAGQHYLSYPLQLMQPLPLLGRIAAEAGDMHIGTGILLLPLLQPVDIAEQVATLDTISGGRFIFGVGLGYEQEEFEAFGINVSDRAKRFEESLEIIKRLWTEDVVSFEGKHFQIRNARPSAWPLQTPYPPVWIAANGDRPIRRAARHGDVWFANPHAKFATLERQMSVYNAAVASYGKERPADVVFCRELLVASSRDDALRLARPALEERYRVYMNHGQDQQNPPGDRFDMPFEQLVEDRFILGDPDYCVEQIKRYEDLGFNYFILDYHWIDLADSVALDSLKLFGNEVLPHFR